MTQLQKRTKQNQDLIVEQLKKIPIIQVACEKVGISRSTYYRWCEQDEEFAKKAEASQSEGLAFVNDMAESQLINAIRNQNLTAVMYWLNHRNKAYSNRLEVTTKTSQEIKLSEEQQELIAKALSHASLLLEPTKQKEKDEK